MRIVFVQSYPIYHDLWSTQQFLAIENRDRWMPGLVTSMGHDVELWAVDRTPGLYSSHTRAFPDYTIRLFAPSRSRKKTKFDVSDALVEHALASPPDLFVLKGTDGKTGIRLIERAAVPEGIPYAFVIGGKYYTRHVPAAAAVLYETEQQREELARPGKPWRKPVDTERLIRLPKVVDLFRFRPIAGVEKQWDVLAIGRLVSNLKGFDALAELPRSLSVAVAGSGPEKDRLSRRYPWIEWLGRVEHSHVPELLNKARVFVHAGRREYYPRVLAEAASCGVPAVALSAAIAEDVLPSACGLRVDRDEFAEQIGRLVADQERLDRMARASRAYAEQSMGIESMRPAVSAMLDRIKSAKGIATSLEPVSAV